MRLLLVFILTVILVSSSSGQYSDRVLKAFEQSYVSEKSGDFKKAAQLIKDVYQEESYEINLRLGWLHYNAGSFDDAKLYYRRAMAILPYSEEAKFGLILPFSTRGEWEEVIKLYNQILANNPGNTVALYRLGMIYYNRKDWTQAARNFQKVVDFYPFAYDGLLMMAWTNLQLGKAREARVLLNKVLLYSPGDKSALEGLQWLK
jgi:tetratricopeptide (TPR) repeat protein